MPISTRAAVHATAVLAPALAALPPAVGAARTPTPVRRATPALLALATGLALAMPAHAVTPAEQLAAFTRAAAAPASAERGRLFFTSLHGREWRCASCHGDRPVTPGRHAGTGKTIEPLAPAAAGTRFTDAAKTEKWFRRNCNDVVGRECSAGEKADLLAWLISLAP